MSKLRTITLSLTLATSGYALAAASASAQTVDLIFNSYLPPFNTTYQVGIRDFSAAIEEESGGTINITIPDATLAPDDRQYEMLVDGIADMAFIPLGSVTQHVKMGSIADLPFNAPTAEAASVALWETYNEYFKEHNELDGVIWLSAHSLDGRQVLNLKDEPIDSIDDFQRIRLWTAPGALSEVGRALGASPMSSQFSEVAENVARGNLDALLFTTGSGGPIGILPNVKHITNIEGGVGSVSFAVAISEEAWSRLSEDQQAAVLRAAEGLPRRTGAIIDSGNERVAPDAAHIVVTEADEQLMADMHAAIDWQIDAWKERAREAGLENPDEALEFYRSVLERETAQ